MRTHRALLPAQGMPLKAGQAVRKKVLPGIFAPATQHSAAPATVRERRLAPATLPLASAFACHDLSDDSWSAPSTPVLMWCWGRPCRRNSGTNAMSHTPRLPVAATPNHCTTWSSDPTGVWTQSQTAVARAAESVFDATLFSPLLHRRFVSLPRLLAA